jgi:large subunit ribosomal protein L22
MIEAQATAKYVRTSAQKAGLVLELIRGRAVNQALATLKFSRKKVARDIEKVLRSAIANAQQKPGFGGDVEQLFVSAAFAGQGPSQKRVRPAPMGRAYRVVKRTAHLTVAVTEKAGALSKPAPRSRVKPAAAAATEAAAPAKPRARKSSKQAGGHAASQG